MRPEPPAGSLEGHYAGPVTRLAAYAVDASLSVTSYGVVLSLVAFLWQLVTREDLALPAQDSPIWLVGLGLWGFLYFAVTWALAAKSPGMAVLGLRIVERDGRELGGRAAVVRALALPLSFLTVGIGFVGIVVGDERRALHDVIAGTTVVYDWDARAARWRLLGRRRAATP